MFAARPDRALSYLIEAASQDMRLGLHRRLTRSTGDLGTFLVVVLAATNPLISSYHAR